MNIRDIKADCFVVIHVIRYKHVDKKKKTDGRRMIMLLMSLVPLVAKLRTKNATCAYVAL